MPSLGAPEIIVIAIVVLILFGGGKLKDVMKSFGEGLREFRKAAQDTKEEVDLNTKTPTPDTADDESDRPAD